MFKLRIRFTLCFHGSECSKCRILCVCAITWRHASFVMFPPKSICHLAEVYCIVFENILSILFFPRTWDLGFQSWEYTPTYRGFDTFSGSLDSSHSADFWNDEQVISDMVMTEEYRLFWEGVKTLDLLAELRESDDPFFVHIVWGDTNSDNDIDDDIRIQSMDESIGDIVRYLKTNGLWDNTLIVFSSDYGVENGQSDESTVWEGAVRVPAFVTGGVLSDDRKGRFPEHVTCLVILKSSSGVFVGKCC